MGSGGWRGLRGGFVDSGVDIKLRGLSMKRSGARLPGYLRETERHIYGVATYTATWIGGVKGVYRE
jgi:hypothetical protein